jgi:hypothetical protein
MATMGTPTMAPTTDIQPKVEQELHFEHYEEFYGVPTPGGMHGNNVSSSEHHENGNYYYDPSAYYGYDTTQQQQQQQQQHTPSHHAATSLEDAQLLMNCHPQAAAAAATTSIGDPVAYENNNSLEYGLAPTSQLQPELVSPGEFES